MKNLFIILTFFFCLSSHASSISDIAANVNSSQKAVQDFFDGKSGFETTFDIVQRTYLQALKFSNQADSKEEIAEAVKYREH